MNWCGRLIQAQVGPDDTVLDLGCGIMSNTLDHIEGYRDKRRLKCKALTGVDFFQPYLDWLNERYPDIVTVKHDLTEYPYPFPDKSQDIVVLTDIVEHMKSVDDVDGLLKEAERIARKKVLVLTPVKFNDNFQGVEAWGLGNNEGQRHHLKITRDFLRDRGYQTNFQAYGVEQYGGYTWAIKSVCLKILHVGDVAGVSCVMAKYQRKLGHDVQVVVSDYASHVHYSEMYGSTRILKRQEKRPRGLLKKIEGSAPVLRGTLGKVRRVLAIVRRNVGRGLRLYRHILFCHRARIHIDEWGPNIVHIHSLFLFPPVIMRRTKIIEFHGTEIRREYLDGSKNRSRKVPWLYLKFLKWLKVPIAYSTPELIRCVPAGPHGATHIPNPVDVEHFSPRKLGTGAIYAHNGYESEDWAISIAKKHGWKLTVQERKGGKQIIHHSIYPAYLARSCVYIDRHLIDSLSKTALEFLAMCGSVVRWDGEIIKGLPFQHEPDFVADLTISKYRDLMGPSL